jgi:hypothetical protein
MKLKSKYESSSRNSAVGISDSDLRSPSSERGIALVITLILLSVTLVMALAFLAISRRESSSVVTAADTAAARLAADSALAGAEAQIMANILSTTNPYNFGLLVSTNYINGNGFDNTITTNDPNNVSYVYPGGGSLNQNDFLQNAANLLYAPRAPVFVTTNQLTGAQEFRFYLDLNRNGIFDSNGIVADVDGAGVTNGNFSFEVGDPEWIGVLEHPDQPHGPNNHFIARIAYLAVPVGNSLDLNAIYNQAKTENVNPASAGSDGFFRNQGVGSWELNLAAFLTDLNTNQWDTNADPYNYQEWETPPFANKGRGFEDALSLLSYRYAYNYANLSSASALLNGAPGFDQDNIDGYSDGPLQTTLDTNADFIADNPAFPWAGADNTNHFFTPSDLFDTTKTENGVTPPGFTDHLQQAGAGNSTYDRYTFYRMLSQLGTDTTPESGKMDINYDNVTTNGPPEGTNFNASWTPLGFFTNAADRMLRAYSTEWFKANPTNYLETYYGIVPAYYIDASGYGVTNVSSFGMTNQIPAFGVANIPVYLNGQFVYTPAVNRALQLAANIYDATVNNRVNGSPDYPDVFRPLFLLTGTNLYIRGYTNLINSGVPNTVSGPADLQLSTPFDVATIISTVSGTNVPSNDNIYGVPWIIGAKKGFPNFNEFSMENNLAVTRRLQVTRPTINSSNSVNLALFATNQMYTMNFNSSLGVELWNSYSASYPGTIWIGINQNSSVMITNDDHGLREMVLQPFSTNALFSITGWHGTAPSYAGNPYSASFIPLTFIGPTLTNSVYRSSYATDPVLYGNAPANPPGLIATNSFSGPVPFEPNSQNGFYLPQFGVLMTNRLQVFMLDATNINGSTVYHVIDYVHFDGPDSPYNVNATLADVDALNNYVGVWDTNYPPGSAGTIADPTYGILNQISISKRGAPPGEDGQWQGDPEAYPPGSSPAKIAQQQSFFQAFFLPGNRTPVNPIATNLQLSVQAPYSPTRNIAQYVTWQANDPLVHDLVSDINFTTVNPSAALQPGLTSSKGAEQVFTALTNLNLGRLNDHYTPWGGNVNNNSADANAYNFKIKDPLAYSSDNWDFPTNKLATVGWLGRVHRGTPWQTVYLKASDILDNNGINTWKQWTGDTQNFDAGNSAPVQDRLLFDLFTTAFNDNATRGQLSVNVAAGSPDPAAGLAAWSALFSGVALPPVGPTNTYTVIAPVGNQAVSNSPLGMLITNINYTRAKYVNPDGLKGAFEHTGDILAVPQLTQQSPFLNLVNTNFNGDEMYEWLPQQTMSLLRTGSPRYVIYSYGQTLKPAPNGIVTSSSTLPSGLNPFGMVTNYQIVSEVVTRAVVRFDSTVTNILGTNSVINNRAVIESFNILPPD